MAPQEIKETKKCIKGYDYKNNATYNEYSIIKKLGGGAYGGVVLAQKNETFEQFAIKQPKRKRQNNRGMSDLDIRKEISVLKEFSMKAHQHIVKLYEVIDDAEDEKIHLIMDYCPNQQILSFDEETLSFRPPRVLLEYIQK